MPDPATLKITEESLANGRCDNCYRTIYRVPGLDQYRHRHNHSLECLKTPDKKLFITPLVINDGEAISTIMLMLIKKVAALVTAHNAVVVMIEELKKERVSIIHSNGETEMVRFDKVGTSRSFIGYTPNPNQVAAIESKKPFKLVTVFGERVPLTPQQVDEFQTKVHDDQPLTALDQRAFLIQWKWFCKCVAPIPVVVTGPNPGHLAKCEQCGKPIIEEEKD